MKTNNKKFDTRAIMIQAHNIRKTEGVTMGEALKKAWAEAKAAAGVGEYDATAQEYFDALKELDKAQARVDAIKAKMQGACLLAPDFTISGFGWYASFKPVTSSRFDSKEFKAAGYADLYKQYSHPQTVNRFLCKPVAM